MNAIDKTEWPPGPWHGEPDKKEWTDKATGLACRIDRMQLRGYLCGSVYVEKGHPLHSLPPGSLPYSELYREREVTVSFPDGDRWAFGFDCGHMCDSQPGSSPIDQCGEYRDIEYVTQQCEIVAARIATAIEPTKEGSHGQ